MTQELIEERQKVCVRSLSLIILGMLEQGTTTFRLSRNGETYDLSLPVDIPESLTVERIADLMLCLKYIFMMNASLAAPQRSMTDVEIPNRGRVHLLGSLTYEDDLEKFTVEIEEAEQSHAGATSEPARGAAPEEPDA